MLQVGVVRGETVLVLGDNNVLFKSEPLRIAQAISSTLDMADADLLRSVRLGEFLQVN